MNLDFNPIPQLPPMPSKEDLKDLLRTVNANLEQLEKHTGINLPRVDASLPDQVDANQERVMQEVDKAVNKALEIICQHTGICLPREAFPNEGSRQDLQQAFDALEKAL